MALKNLKIYRVCMLRRVMLFKMDMFAQDFLIFVILTQVNFIQTFSKLPKLLILACFFMWQTVVWK